MEEFQKIKERIPSATYRLQLSKNFTLNDASRLVGYLNDLGVSHVYCSPILASHSGSSHGYDVVDHNLLNPGIGEDEQLESFVKLLRENNMGMIIDIVPNHMFINDEHNRWWFNVLENGPSSPYAHYFDIDWKPLRSELANKVLLPLLEDQYGAVLESRKLKLIYEEGSFKIQYYEMKLPTDPATWIRILKGLIKEAEEDPGRIELASIATAIQHLPLTTDAEEEKVKERQREKEVIKQRLQRVLQEKTEIWEDLQKIMELFNGVEGDPDSFNALEEFINAQPYRLCFWRVANNEINYRRFFDICALAGIRTELEDVFEATHKKIFELIEKNMIDGLRIDHIDGLINPKKYLEWLQDEIGRCLKDSPLKGKEDLFYIVAEKILMGAEQPRNGWQLHGTVGYDFLNIVNGLFVDLHSREKMLDCYAGFTGIRTRIQDLFYDCKKLILLVSMSGEHNVLSRVLDQISEQHRSSRDFTEASLTAALRDVIACFPVYRSYIDPDEKLINEEDRTSVMTAINNAKRRNPATNNSIFDFIKTVLLLEHPQNLSEEQVALRNNFVKRFQQLTGAVTAKGIEDTAFYRYHPLASINEVGSTLRNFGISAEEFHRSGSVRNEKWPHTLLCTSTHDTKMSEDARSRLNVLSEMSAQWSEVLQRWSSFNKEHKTQINETFVPDENDEQLFYQALLATWPLYPMDPSGHIKYLERIQRHMQKSMREAKVYSSWINPNEEYEGAMRKFIHETLSLDPQNNLFLDDFKEFALKVQRLGMLNALSLVVLKMTSPGVPDVYQGNEVWDFSLVDPDNRRPVDFTNSQYLLETLKKKETSRELVCKLVENPIDGRVKLHLTTLLLNLRKRQYDVFTRGAYLPLKIVGKWQNHAIAYARKYEDQIVIVVAAHLCQPLADDVNAQITEDRWEDTAVQIPVEMVKKYKNIFTSEVFEEPGEKILMKDIMNKLPAAVLESI